MRQEDLRGYRFFRRVRRLLKSLHHCAGHPNRRLHYDDYAALVLFYFFNPAITSLRGLQAVSELPKVCKALGLRRMSLGSMSESVRLFDPELLARVFRKLARRAPHRPADPRLRELNQVLTVADGTLLRALPRMSWALWLSDHHRAAKAHVQLEVLKEVPVQVEVTAANSPETERLRANLEPGRLYVLDRGYRDFALFQAIVEAQSSFVVRLHANTVYEVLEHKELSAAARQAGVVWDGIVQLGSTEQTRNRLHVPLRLVRVRVPGDPCQAGGYRRKRPSSKKTSFNTTLRSSASLRSTREPGGGFELIIATDRLDLPADLIALIYRHRWKVELFFRMLKCLLACRHLISESLQGVTIQLYCALIAALLLAECTGMRPNKRAYELMVLYLQGWADEQDVVRQLAKLKAKEGSKKNS